MHTRNKKKQFFAIFKKCHHESRLFRNSRSVCIRKVLNREHRKRSRSRHWHKLDLQNWSRFCNELIRKELHKQFSTYLAWTWHRTRQTWACNRDGSHAAWTRDYSSFLIRKRSGRRYMRLAPWNIIARPGKRDHLDRSTYRVHEFGKFREIIPPACVDHLRFRNID